jgi:hypothetical protein
MRTSFPFLRTSILFFLASNSPLPLRADAIEDRVSEIRARYNGIERAKLRRSTIRFESEMDPFSAAWTGHFEGDDLVKVHIASALGDHGAYDEYFYYDRGRLFFVYAVENSWYFTGRSLPNGEGETIDRTAEHRIYLSEGRVIRHLVKEASAKDAASLPSLIAKAPNRPAKDEEDAERAERFVAHGEGANKIRQSSDLARLYGAD